MDITDLQETIQLPENFLEEEIESADKATEAVAALEALYESIMIQGGVSMEHAVQMVNEHALQLSDLTPVNSFTRHPSRTNLNVSVEAISIGRTVLLVALIGAAAVILIKLTKWLINYFRSNKTKEAKTAVLVVNVVEMGAAAEKVEKIIGSEEYQAIVERVQANRDLLNVLSTLQEDLLTGGYFNTMATTCWQHLNSWDEIITGKMKRFTDLSNQHIRDSDTAGAEGFIQLMNDIATPIPMFAFPQEIIHNQRVVESPNSTILPIAQAIQQAVFDADRTKIRQRTKDLAGRVVNAPFLLINFYGPMDKSLQNSVRLDKAATDLRSVKQTTSVNPEVAAAYQRAIENITEETRALTLMWSFVEYCANARRTLLLGAAQILSAVMGQLTIEIGKADPQNKAALQKITTELRGRMKHFG